MLGDTTSEQRAMQKVIGKLIGHATGALIDDYSIAVE